MTSNDLIDKMKVDFTTFLEACKVLSEDQALKSGVCGEWSAKQVVDHLTGWQVESVEILDRLLGSDEKDLELDIDGFNARSVMERASLSWMESLDACETSFEAFDSDLAEISEEEYQAHTGLASWVRAMIHEYRFHLAHIRKAQEK